MRNGVILAVIAGSALLNGLYLDHVPLWRQLFLMLLVVAAYLHGRHLPVRRGWEVLAAVALPGVVAGALDPSVGAGALLVLALFAVLPWLAGRFRRQQADLVEAGRERIARLSREREFIAERVALRERARIAADLHDSLGHELALIALRAGALELAADMTEENRQAAARLRASAVTATDELRHTLGALRESGTASTEPPDESVEALVDRARGAGMAVALRRTGERTPLPPLVDRAAHRVVREALTNAARHAPGTDVLVRVQRTRDTVTVIVSNPVPVPVAPPAGPGPVTGAVPGSASGAVPVPPGGGSGIAGLRERVRLLGGTLRAGPGDGAFTVTARLPYDRAGVPSGRGAPSSGEGSPEDREGGGESR
ncbi:sensor histidine kinase [Streptosporangium sp. NPDC050855]|uniref:sensor histidine kinase n=1 Tax=Streptosporangium sp. NPDC050855 TaxID=3366194 RepID=UPI0037AC0952